MKLALAGMAIHLFFSSMTQGIILLNEDSNDTVMFWLVGSLAGIKWNQIMMILPCIVIAVIVTILWETAYNYGTRRRHCKKPWSTY